MSTETPATQPPYASRSPPVQNDQNWPVERGHVGQGCRCGKGQIFTSDFVISMFVFLMMVNVTYLLWVEAYEQQDQLNAERVMQQKSYHIASLLARTPGYPANWTNETVEIIGLAEPDHVLQDTKMDELDAMSTADIGTKLGLDSRTNVVINVTNATGTMRADGRDLVWGTPPDNPDSIAVERRSVLVNATNLYQRGTLHVLLWR